MRAMHKWARNSRGFTLLELLVVMVILVMLAGAVTVVVIKRVEEAKRARAVTDIESLGNALDQFSLHNHKYPATEEGLSALRVKPQGDEFPNWDGPYINKDVPQDPWGNEYRYQCPGDHNQDYDLFTLGKDGREGGTGSDADITNWESN
ncbi:MAG: type II secretion system major pseudopilin GspG [Armatimonadota bacterium]